MALKVIHKAVEQWRKKVQGQFGGNVSSKPINKRTRTLARTCAFAGSVRPVFREERFLGKVKISAKAKLSKRKRRNEHKKARRSAQAKEKGVCFAEGCQCGGQFCRPFFPEEV